MLAGLYVAGAFYLYPGRPVGGADPERSEPPELGPDGSPEPVAMAGV